MKIMKLITESSLALFAKILISQIGYIRKFSKQNARCNNSKSPNKILTDILMNTHALEKALSLPNPRKKFGKEKAICLCGDIKKYINNYGTVEDLRVSISLLKEYIEFHKKNHSFDDDLLKIENSVNILVNNAETSNLIFDEAGTYSLKASDLKNNAKGDFLSLVNSRFAVRNFSLKPVSDELVNQALNIAKKSPSACNRQSYRAHVFRGEQKNEILKMQRGAKSFYELTSAVILISYDINRYYTREPYLGYVDASLFAMTLMYAFTYLGVGSIPLTLGIDSKILEKMQKEFNIPANETPVILIAIGNYLDEFKAAKSFRNPIEYFTTYH